MNTDDKKFDKQFKKIAKIAFDFSIQSAKFDEMFTERFGIHYSELGIDQLIDSLNYGSGLNMSLSKLDKLMEDNGYPKIEEEEDDD
jgi:hypothetical protein